MSQSPRDDLATTSKRTQELSLHLILHMACLDLTSIMLSYLAWCYSPQLCCSPD
ncbi:hypothetical protein SCLCIDRAFT_1215414 [Scleroderma citrinum Foug A]|uniref:Uncharacterized protein n=1 Tax=Scleroderma citrinum Foug A TaxID=1036808 RepID=A0A0C3DN50_9AGAM|nr:hypothetical protein SCLCIDRAFT_1215414 [Scleroderma citrinum Foug A]